MQHNAQERGIDLKTAVVLDKTKLPEFVHEKIDARARCADHLRQRFWKHSRQSRHVQLDLDPVRTSRILRATFGSSPLR